jgi:hypothetical protein
VAGTGVAVKTSSCALVLRLAGLMPPVGEPPSLSTALLKTRPFSWFALRSLGVCCDFVGGDVSLLNSCRSSVAAIAFMNESEQNSAFLS